MSVLNAVLRAVVDGLLYPFRGLSPWVGLLVVSVLTAVPMLLVFKATSNQEALAAAKRKIHASLFEIRLFNDDLRAILHAQLRILRHNLTYLRLSLPPMIWIVPPLVLLFAQLQFHYGYRGLALDEPALVEARLSEDGLGSGKPELRLQVPAGLRVETPALWMPAERLVGWRISAERPGEYELRMTLADATLTKTLYAGGGIRRRSPERVAPSFLRELLYPAEPPLPAGAALESITVSYPERSLGLLGVEMPWWVGYLLLLFLCVLALRGFFGVTI